MARRKKRRSGGATTMPMLERPGKSHYKRRMKWLFDFLNADIASLNHGDFVKVLHDFLVFVHGDQEDRLESYKAICSRASESDLYREQLIQFQRFTRESILELLEQAQQYADPDKWRSVMPAQEWMPSVQCAVYLRGSDELTMRPAFETRVRTSATQSPDERRLPFTQENIRFIVLSLLERFPLSSIRICPNCDHFFTATVRKEKDLCRKCLIKSTHKAWQKEKENREALTEYEFQRQRGMKIPIPELRAQFAAKRGGKK